MKKILIVLSLVFSSVLTFAQLPEIIDLTQPDLNRGLPLMKALSLRASVKEFDTTAIKLKDLSDLLWAANGVNRPESGKRTAPSALNAQDIDVYAFFKNGVYLYDALRHQLKLVASGDYRYLICGEQKDYEKAPLMLVLVSDVSRFPFGDDSSRVEWGAMDAGLVSQNISLFCASLGLHTRPRAGMEKEQLHKIMKLKKSQYLMMNSIISY